MYLAGSINWIQKWSKNGQKWPKNGQKWPKNGQKSTKNDKNFNFQKYISLAYDFFKFLQKSHQNSISTSKPYYFFKKSRKLIKIGQNLANFGPKNRFKKGTKINAQKLAKIWPFLITFSRFFDKISGYKHCIFLRSEFRENLAKFSKFSSLQKALGK